MNISPRRICNFRFFRNKLSSKYKVLLGLFIAVSFVYHVVPRKLLFKTPWTEVSWRDSDFRLDVAKNEIIILRWTSSWNGYSDAEVLTPKECPYVEPSRKEGSGKVFDIPCRITHDRRYRAASGALVFHSWDLYREEIPKERSKDQLWVYQQSECPKYTRLNLRNYPNVFNWTMTYRRDSDIYHPYSFVVPIGNTESTSDTDLITSNSTTKISLNLANRPNLVAWIVSSCVSTSKREYFVKELQKYIPVSVFGFCGQDCPGKDCYAHVAKTHKFYLSFENSLCKDYITEKFFIPLRRNLIPVVYGGTGLEDYSAIAPPGSYIDVRNFKSAKHLAEYLVYLDQTEEEYMKYFEWKSKFKVIESQVWCNLCQRVFEHSQLAPGERSHKWYKDLWTWWNYISYEPSFEQDEVSITSGLSVIRSSYNYTLERARAPACQSSIRNLTGSESESLDFQPGFFNGRGISKWGKWAKDAVVG